MRVTFDRLLWAAVQEYRDQTIVVDNLHAYGIIRDRFDSLWEQMRLLQASPDQDHQQVLNGLLGVAMAAQLSAEHLGLINTQMGVDESADEAEEEALAARNNLGVLVEYIDAHKHRIQSLQKGFKRYSIDFDEDTLLEWKRQVG